MAMSVGGSKGVMAEPNIVPLIDVLLVLIIIFMVINPPNPQGLRALVPQPNPPNQKQNEDLLNKTIVVQVTASGEVMINQTKETWDKLGPDLTNIFSQRVEKTAFVKGDDNVPFGPVAQAISIMRGAGIDHIGLIPASIEEGK